MRVFEGMKDHVHLVVGGCWLGLTRHHAGLKSFGSGSTQSWSAKDKDNLCTGQELLVYPMKPQSVLAKQGGCRSFKQPSGFVFQGGGCKIHPKHTEQLHTHRTLYATCTHFFLSIRQCEFFLYSG